MVYLQYIQINKLIYLFNKIISKYKLFFAPKLLVLLMLGFFLKILIPLMLSEKLGSI
jgi:hypothetical protein